MKRFQYKIKRKNDKRKMCDIPHEKLILTAPDYQTAALIFQSFHNNDSQNIDVIRWNEVGCYQGRYTIREGDSEETIKLKRLGQL